MNNKDWWYEEINGITLIRFRHFEKQTNFKYFITTRKTGLSKEPVSSFNIGFMEHDLSEHVLGNRKLLAEALDIPITDFVFTQQTHSDHVKIVKESDKQKGLYVKENAIQDNDGFIVSDSGICPVIMVADCVPVIVFDPVKKVAGVFHAGWRGTVKKIVQKGVSKMINEFGTNPFDLLASVGPSMGPCCYEVGDEVVLEVKKAFPENINELLLYKGKEKPHFDLWMANKIQLLQLGVNENNVIICDACNFHNPEYLFSWRYNNGITGRMGAGVYLKN